MIKRKVEVEACHPRNKFSRGSLYVPLIISTSLYFPTWKLFSQFASFVTNNSSHLLGGKQLSGVMISRLYLEEKGSSTCLEKEIVNESYPIKGIISIYFNCKRILQSVFKLRGNVRSWGEELMIMIDLIYDRYSIIYISKIGKNNYCLFSRSFNL